MNVSRSRISAFMSLLLSLLALFASLEGILNSNIYGEVFTAGTISKFLLTGSIAQDIITIPLAAVLLLLSIVFLRKPGLKTFISILGLVWYFFYAYGLYVIQGSYTSIYVIYLAIFGLSIYSMIWGLISFESVLVTQTMLPGAVRKAVGIFLIMILVMLIPGWLLRIMPDIMKHVPGETYGVYILDLCIVFPALGQISYMLFKKKPFGNILAGIALIKAMTLCLSWSFSEWFSPVYGNSKANYGMLIISSLLTLASLILLIPYMRKLKRE